MSAGGVSSGETLTLKEALRVLLDAEHAEDWIYDVRDREGLGWEGPRVTAYARAMRRLRTELEHEG